MSEMKLSAELIDAVQKSVAEHDPDAADPGVMVQYLAAIVGVVVGHQTENSERREAIFSQICDLGRQVMAQVEPPEQAPPAEASGVWRPGDA